MTAVVCRLAGFIATWLDPDIWRLRLSGTDVVVDGHVLGDPRYELDGDCEHEYRRCERCGTELHQGWRWMA